MLIVQLFNTKLNINVVSYGLQKVLHSLEVTVNCAICTQVKLASILKS